MSANQRGLGRHHHAKRPTDANPVRVLPLEKINEVSERVKQGQVAGRAVLTPAS